MPDVIKKGPYIYLHADDTWFQYDERSTPLGAGAMGTVYLGHVYNSSEKVAIKRVMDKYANNPNIRRRAKLEASLMFRHKNLVEMLGYCEVHPTQGPIFIISKLVQGQNIDKFVRQNFKANSDRTKKICEMLFPVFDALDYIHSKKIVHMDIKPSNIMIENGCNIRLMDLGIANVDEQRSSDGASKLTGTPKYAAPEQFGEGLNGTRLLTEQTDIYQLGVTIYELLTGSNPYSSSSLEESIKKHTEIVLPKSDSINKHVLAVLRKATSFYVSERYASAREMKFELQQAINKKSFWPF